MTAADVLAECESAGLTITLSGPYCDSFQLLVSPREIIAGDARLQALIRQHRQELIDELYSRLVDKRLPRALNKGCMT